VVAAHPGQDGQIGEAVLGRPEGRADDRAGRVIDGADQGQPWATPLEPVMRAAVDLDEQPGLGHPRSTTPVLRRPPRPDRPDPGVTEQALERRAPDDDPLVLGQQLGEVAVVDPAIACAGEFDDPLPGARLDASWRGSPAVAVDDPIDPQRAKAAAQPPGRPLAGAEQPGGFNDRQRALPPAGQDIDSLLVSCIQGQSLPHRWRLTKSLSS
jgi:hypothetical protein